MIDAIALDRFVANLLLAVIAGTMLLRFLGHRGAGLSRTWMVWFAAATAGLIALQIVLIARAVAPEGPALVLGQLIGHTWSGSVLALRFGFALFAALLFAIAREDRTWSGLCIAVAGLLLIPLSGHGATAEPANLSLALHATHTCAGCLWVGGLCCLAGLAVGLRGNLDRFRSALAAFSPWALALVIVAVLSGTAAAVLQVGSLAAFIGTGYGRLLFLKVFVFLPLALLAAAWLRRRYLGSSVAGIPVLAIGFETVMGIAILLAASALSQGVPARNDDIVWPPPSGLNLSHPASPDLGIAEME